MRYYPKQGFTLLEIMIVIIIVGVLASLAMPRFFSTIEFSRNTEALTNLSAMRQGMERCYMQCISYCNCNWDVMAIENPSNNPNSHFTYSIHARGTNWYTIKAVRNTRDNGDPSSVVYLTQNLTTVTISGTGAFSGLQ